MKIVSSVATALGVMLLMACGDTAGPSIDDALSAAKGGNGRGRGNQNRKEVVVVTDTDPDAYQPNVNREYPESFILRQSPDAPPLEGLDFTFWAVAGAHSTLQVNYLPGGSGAAMPLLKVKVHKKSLGFLARGDSVEIQVAVHGSDFVIEMGPSGLEFTHPVEITVYYGNAELDLNGDGVVNHLDRAIEREVLSLMYQEQAGDPWQNIGAVRSQNEQSFTIEVDHFSNYAVGW